MKKQLPAAVLAAILLGGVWLSTGCSLLNTTPEPTATPEPTEAPTTNIRWVLPSESMPLDVIPVLEQFNSQLDEQMPGVRLYLEIYNPAEYEEKLPAIMAAGNYDIIWGDIHLLDDYPDAFLPLDSYLNGSALSQSRPDYLWDVPVRNGKIYGIPAFEDYTSSDQFAVLSTLLSPEERTSLDALGQKEDTSAITYFTSLEASLAKAWDAQRIPMMPASLEALMRFDYEPIISGVGLAENDGTLTAVNYYATQEFADWLTFARTWYNSGYYGANILVNQPETTAYASMFLTGEYADGDVTALLGSQCDKLSFTPRYIGNDAGQSSLLYLNAHSDKADEAIQLLMLLNTNADLFNLLSLGIEDVNYRQNYAGVEYLLTNADGTPRYGIDGSIIGNQTLNLALSSDQRNEIIAMNDVTALSPALGFVFDPTPVATQLDTVSKVLDIYQQRLITGVSKNYETLYETMLEQLGIAGMDQIVAEVQKQLDDYLGKP